MPFCELRYFSRSLEMQTACNVILPDPETWPPPYPVMYLLHGLSDDHTIWCRRTSIERYVESLPLMVVMPNGGRGFYCDAREGFAYGSSIVKDLVGLIDRLFPTRAERAGRCIGGLSMGGYGAMRLALGHPDLFCSVVSHSGALYFGHLDLPEEDPRRPECARITSPGGPDDLFALAERLTPAEWPAIRVDCGVDDFLIEHNRAFHAHLTRLGVPHEYEEFPGAHTWDYWDLHVQEAIGFHRRALGI